MNKIVKEILSLLPTKQNKASILQAFEKIEKLVNDTKISSGRFDKLNLYRLWDWVKENETKATFNKLDKFFKKYCTIARKLILESPHLLEGFLAIHKGNFLMTYEKRGDWKDVAKVPFSYDLALEAYNHTLDQYDANKRSGTWAGFWSLADFENGKVTGVYLGDTADREYFWRYIWRKLDIPER